MRKRLALLIQTVTGGWVGVWLFGVSEGWGLGFLGTVIALWSAYRYGTVLPIKKALIDFEVQHLIYLRRLALLYRRSVAIYQMEEHNLNVSWFLSQMGRVELTLLGLQKSAEECFDLKIKADVIGSNLFWGDRLCGKSLKRAKWMYKLGFYSDVNGQSVWANSIEYLENFKVALNNLRSRTYASDKLDVDPDSEEIQVLRGRITKTLWDGVTGLLSSEVSGDWGEVPTSTPEELHTKATSALRALRFEPPHEK